MYRNIKSLLRISLFVIFMISILLICSCSLKSNNKLNTNSTTKINTYFKNTGNQYNNSCESTAPMSKSAAKNPPPKTIVYGDDYIDYIVNEGDTLFSICRKYQIFCPEGTAVKTVIALNNLTQANKLKEGMTIELPDKYFISGIKYTVKKGDTLFSIARKHTTDKDINKAMEFIMKDNFMTSNEVNVGDQLFIENGK